MNGWMDEAPWSPPPGSLPCCPRCQILSPRGIRIETGACVSFSAPMEHCGWSQLCPYPSPSRGQEDPEGWRFIKINSSSSLPLVARVQFGGPPHWPPFLQPPSPRSLQGGRRRPRINPHTAPAAASSPQVHTASDPVTMHDARDLKAQWRAKETTRALGLSGLGLDPNVHHFLAG